MGEHLRHVAGRLQPDLRRIEEQQPLIPAVVVLSVGLQAVGRRDDCEPAVAEGRIDRLGVGQGPLLRVVARVEFKNHHPVPGAAGELFQRIGEGKHAVQRRVDVHRRFGAHVHVEPDFAGVPPGKLEYAALSCQASDPGGRSADMPRIDDGALVGKVAHDEDNRRILRPNGLGQGLESGGITLIHALLVAQFQVAEAVGLRVAVGGAAAAPGTLDRSLGVLHEIGHVLRLTRRC